MKDSGDAFRKLAPGVIASMPQDRKNIKAALSELIGRRKVLGVYLTTMQPYARIMENLEKDNIDHSSLFFLDLVGKESGPNENIFILKDPSDLTELSVVITEVMENEGIGFLMIDSIGGLESYVDAASVKKFLHALVSYVKKLNKSLIITYSGKESQELMNFVVQLSDYHKEK